MATLPERTRILIGLGGNIGGPEAVLLRFGRAVTAIDVALAGDGVRMSSVYESDPVGPVSQQPRFLNAVIELALARAIRATELLAEILAVEESLGRVRRDAVAKGPRTIDLDVLFAGEHIVRAPQLTLPHPGVADRAFVLVPLAELVGDDWLMPGFGRTVADCAQRPELATQRSGLRLYAPRPAPSGERSRGA